MLKSNWGEAIAHCLAFPEISAYVYIHLVLYLLAKQLGIRMKFSPQNLPETALFGTRQGFS